MSKKPKFFDSGDADTPGVRRVAIVKFHNSDFSYDHDSHFDSSAFSSVISSTEFDFVDENTYKTLKAAQHKYGFVLLEQPNNQKEFICSTVADYAAQIKREEEAQAARIRKYQEEDAARKAKAAERKKARLLKQALDNPELVSAIISAKALSEGSQK